MRKYPYILFLLTLLVTASCTSDEKAEIFPEEFFKVMYIKDSGERNLVMNTAQDVVTQQMLVIKGGAHPEMEADCRLEVMSVEEAAAQYGYMENQIGIIPEGSYKLPGTVSFSKDTPYQYINVDLYPAQMAPAMRGKPSLIWILPLKLVSDNGAVNRDNCLVLMTCTVQSPFIGWSQTGVQEASIDYKTLSCPIGLEITKTEINKQAFSGTIEALGEDAVAAYNQEHGTAYNLLPEESYTLGGISFEADKLSGSALVNLSRIGLMADKDYLLPVKLVSVTSSIYELSEEVKYLVVSNPKYAYKEVEPDKWKIAFCNCEDRNSRYWAMNMFDRNTQTGFRTYQDDETQTKTGARVDDFRYPDEGVYPGTITYDEGNQAGIKIGVPYPCCDGVRSYEDIVVVIDLGEEVNIHSIGLSKLPGNISYLDLKSMEFFTEDQFTFETAAQYKGVDNTKFRAAIANYKTADAGNDWRLFITWDNIPEGTQQEGLPTVWKTTPEALMNSASARGRYLKLHSTDTHRPLGSLSIAIGNIYIRRLITIDGEPAL